MAITNFDFPGVTLSQSYAESTTGTVRTLGVACVGAVYKTHSSESSSEAAQITTAYSTSSDTAVTPLPGRTSGATLDTDTTTQRLVVKDGAYAYFTESTASNFTAGTGSVTFPNYDISGSSAKTEFGSRGVLAGDPVVLTGATATVVAVVLAVTGNNCILLDSTVQASAGTLSKISFCEYADAVYAQSSTTFSIASETLTIKSKIDSTSSLVGLTVTLPDLDNCTASLLVPGELYIEYRERLTSYTGQLGSVSSYTDIVNTLGVPCKDNPMALACYAAMLAGNDAIVYFTGVDAETSSDYITALDFLERYDMIYSIVPLTTNAEIIKQCAASCIAVSSSTDTNVRRALWYGINTDSTLLNNPARVADLIAQRKARTTTERAVCVWADDILYGGETVPNYIGAAAAAGMRSYEPCHRPISNLGYSFFSVAETHGFTRSQLKLLGADGIWIIANDQDGLPINMRQVTTAVSNNINKDEESVVANVDDIALALANVGKDLVGCSNISQAMIDDLHDSLSVVLDNYTLDKTNNAYIGPQLTSYEITSLYQDSVNLDHIYVDIDLTPPKPFNRFHISLRII